MPEEFAGIGDGQVHEGYYFAVWKIYCYSKPYANDAGVVTNWMPLPEPPSLV